MDSIAMEKVRAAASAFFPTTHSATPTSFSSFSPLSLATHAETSHLVAAITQSRLAAAAAARDLTSTSSLYQTPMYSAPCTGAF